ncbi:hypothetical protein [Nocardia iowensis]|uniref:Uncharacterized protein n=1 Tax=Nocardia iowensis TaxID=204891 RepID=A0ABX8S0N9_NOCIO|nr:hypothetical protein [Nocardia iowensis]QXN94652.1 hypothetical protein KV110_17320 [Nocardia iowensis]
MAEFLGLGWQDLIVGGVSGAAFLVGGPVGGAIAGAAVGGALGWATTGSFGEGCKAALVNGAFGAIPGGVLGGATKGLVGGGAKALANSFTANNVKQIVPDVALGFKDRLLNSRNLMVRPGVGTVATGLGTAYSGPGQRKYWGVGSLPTVPIGNGA